MALNSFTCTSTAPYDRHSYEIVLKNQSCVFFETWEEAQAYWCQHCKIPDFLNVVIVHDRKTKPGFGK